MALFHPTGGVGTRNVVIFYPCFALENRVIFTGHFSREKRGGILGDFPPRNTPGNRRMNG